jgi:hypothetical protein
MSDPYRWRAKGLLSKIGSGTYGSDSEPTGDANAMLPIDVDVQAYAAREIARGIEMPWLGSNGKILVEKNMSLSFKTEIAGGGTPLGTAPAWAVLMRACGMAEVVTETTKVEYNPITDDMEWCDHYFYISGNLHKGLGSRGKWALNFTQNELPTIQWNMMALVKLADISASAAPSLTTSAWKKPVTPNKVNTALVTIGGYSVKARSLTVDSGLDVQFRGLMGDESIQIGDREVTGELRIESANVTAHNFFSDADNRTESALSLVHGTAAGNIVKLDAPKVEVGAPQYVNDNKFVGMVLPLTFKPSSGNDEIKITCV